MAEAKYYTCTGRAVAELSIVTWLKKFYVQIIFLIADYATLIAAEYTAGYLRGYFLPAIFPLPPFAVTEYPLFWILPFPFILLMHFDGLYLKRLPMAQQIERLLQISLYAMALVICMMYISHAAQDVSRLFIALTWVFSLFYLAGERFLLKKMLISSGLWHTPVVIIGAGKTSELLAEHFQRNSANGYQIVGLVEDSDNICEPLQSYPIIGTFDKAVESIRRVGVRNVLIAAPGLDRKSLHDLIYRLQPYVDNITFVPDLFGIPVQSMELETLFQEKAILLRVRNNLALWSNRVLKYLFDFVVSLSALPFFLISMLIFSILIYIDSPGPVIFVQQRLGKDGKLFPCYKFRTMVMNAEEKLERYLAANPAAREEWQRDFKLKNDPRVTRIGQFLRKTSLDELPQVLNVLRGEMSWVGPRPIIQAEVEKYDDYIQDYYMVRPGITGMWQVSGRSDVTYEARVQMDSWYVRNWSLWLDIVMLLKTVLVVVQRKGAY